MKKDENETAEVTTMSPWLAAGALTELVHVLSTISTGLAAYEDDTTTARECISDAAGFLLAARGALMATTADKVSVFLAALKAGRRLQ